MTMTFIRTVCNNKLFFDARKPPIKAGGSEKYRGYTITHYPKNIALRYVVSSPQGVRCSGRRSMMEAHELVDALIATQKEQLVLRLTEARVEWLRVKEEYVRFKMSIGECT